MRLFRSSCVLAAAALASTVAADTWVVDDNGGAGVDFTDIPPAIAIANAGDVILIQAGQYSPFVLEEAVALIGYGRVEIDGSAQVIGVSGPGRAALVNLTSQELEILACSTTVILQDLTHCGWIVVDQCSDVRVTRVASHSDFGSPTRNGATLSAARVEFARSHLAGSDFTWVSNNHNGGHGIACSSGARLHLAATQAVGGGGGGTLFSAGEGGCGITVDAASEVIVTGDGTTRIIGGGGGECSSCDQCDYNGMCGFGAWIAGGLLHHSGAHFQGGFAILGPFCDAGFCEGLGGFTHVENMPSDPLLDATGPMQAGSSIVFTVSAPAGSTATLFLGRTPVLIPTPPVLIEQLVSHEVRYSLGVIPASGTVQRTIPVRASLPPGLTFYAQAEVLYSAGDLRRTNSTPIVLR